MAEFFFGNSSRRENIIEVSKLALEFGLLALVIPLVSKWKKPNSHSDPCLSQRDITFSIGLTTQLDREGLSWVNTFTVPGAIELSDARRKNGRKKIISTGANSQNIIKSVKRFFNR